MTDFVTDLDKAKPTEFDPVADGAAEIRNIKTVLRDTFPNANTALTVSNESIVEAVQKVNSGEINGGGDGTTKSLFAAVTYNGRNIHEVGHNVVSVQWLEQPENPAVKFARVTFASGVPDLPQNPNGTLDANLNIQVTAFSNADNSLGLAGVAVAAVTEITRDYVEIVFLQTDQTFTWQVVWNQAFCLMVAEN